MGILRTDKISGLEKPTAVTGSVEFDGTGKAVSFPAGNDFAYGTGDFTIEGWFYPTVIGQVSGASASSHIFFGQTVSGTNYLLFGVDDNGKLLYYSTASGGGSDRFSSAPDGSVVLNQWQHIALCRSSGTTKAFVDGKEIISISDTFDFDNTDRNPTIGNYTHTFTTQPFNGYVSNFRILKGTALYTSDFTVPTHELEVIGDTVLLCCNNPDSAGAEATGKTATVSGSAPASTVSPGLTRDFTFGTEFRGVTTFDTQGYFVPPSGTTEQRYSKGVGNGRALFTGGYDSPATINTIDYITVSTTGNAKDFGDLASIRLQPGSLSSSTRGLIGGGRNPGVTSDIDFVTIASTGNGFDFGDLTVGRRAMAALSNSSRGIWAGGDSPSRRDIIDFVTISTTSNAVDFGDLSEATNTFEGCSSSTRGLLMGGENATSPGGTNDISFFTIASLGNAQDFGNLTEGRRGPGSCSSSTRGLCGGGFDSPSLKDTIDFVTIASTGNATDFGNLTVARWLMTSTSNSIRGVWGGGYIPSPAAEQDVIDYVTIASTGNAIDFGNLQTSRRSLSSCSDSHGGLS
jgi:hypothetical protein